MMHIKQLDIQNKNKQLAVLVNWTFHSRYEFRFENIQHPWAVINSWTLTNHKSQAKKDGIFDFAETYYC